MFVCVLCLILSWTVDDVPEEDYELPLSKADVLRQGKKINRQKHKTEKYEWGVERTLLCMCMLTKVDDGLVCLQSTTIVSNHIGLFSTSVTCLQNSCSFNCFWLSCYPPVACWFARYGRDSDWLRNTAACAAQGGRDGSWAVWHLVWGHWFADNCAVWWGDGRRGKHVLLPCVGNVLAGMVYKFVIVLCQQNSALWCALIGMANSQDRIYGPAPKSVTPWRTVQLQDSKASLCASRSFQFSSSFKCCWFFCVIVK